MAKATRPGRQAVSIPQAMRIALDHYRAGRLQEAERLCKQVLTLDPASSSAFQLLGLIARRVGKHEVAVQMLDRAIGSNPNSASALFNRGNALKDLKRLDEALASYDRALALKPDYADAHSNRGLVLKALGRFDEALASCDRALEIQPDRAELACNRGNVLGELGRFEEALASYDRALALKPGDPDALSSRGVSLKSLGRFEEALASYAAALEHKPDFAQAHYNESLCRLLTGDLERGWAKYEWRWRCEDFPSARREFFQPLWLGDADIRGKTLLLYAEQGLGDTLQFARYAQQVAAMGARVILEVQPELKTLLAGVPGAHQVVGRGEDLPGFDFQCPLLSLPLACGTSLQNVSASIPYLAFDQGIVAAWRRKLEVKGKPLVGLCWKGNAANREDRKRSLPLAELSPLLSYAGIQFVSLVKDLDDKERAIVAGLPNFIHPGADFLGTAELLGALDLVISVDTAWAHCAGALGKPLWVLLRRIPSWHWLVERDDSPWYPTARLFRQKRAGDWRPAIDNAAREIARLAG